MSAYNASRICCGKVLTMNGGPAVSMMQTMNHDNTHVDTPALPRTNMAMMNTAVASEMDGPAASAAGSSISLCMCNDTKTDAFVNGTVAVTLADMSPPTYLFIYVTVLSVVITSGGVVGNLLVVQVIVRIRAMRTRMNYFLLSLSLADLLVLFVCQPTAILDLYNKEVWVLGAALCKIIPYLENAAHHCSVLSLLAISIERYIAICHPFRQQRRRKNLTNVVMIIACWCASLIFCIPFLFMSRLDRVEYFDGSVQNVCRTATGETSVRVFIVVDFVLCLVLPLLLLTVLYGAVVIRLMPSRGEFQCTPGSGAQQDTNLQTAGSRKSRRSVIRMMLAVVALFYVCLLPMRTMILWVVFESPEKVEKLGFSTYQNLLFSARLLILLNSAGNPVIYGLMSTKFRKAFRTSFPTCLDSSSTHRHSQTMTSSRQALQMRSLRSQIVSGAAFLNGQRQQRTCSVNSNGRHHYHSKDNGGEVTPAKILLSHDNGDVV